jgi:PD-(D/E)XK nuclease superfamily
LRESLVSKRRLCIRREDPTLHGRSIDIVLYEGDAGLGIENKPGLVHQHEQVSDYAGELKRRFGKGWAMIYLSGDGTSPPEESLRFEERAQLLGSGNYLEINYAADLTEWLYTCTRACDADKVRWFLRDFHDYVAGNFKNQEKQDDGKDA